MLFTRDDSVHASRLSFEYRSGMIVSSSSFDLEGVIEDRREINFTVKKQKKVKEVPVESQTQTYVHKPTHKKREIPWGSRDT